MADEMYETDTVTETLPPILGHEPQHINPDGETDAEEGAKLGGLGGVVLGGVAGAMAGPVGALLGAVVGGVVAAAASGAAVAAVDTVDGDSLPEVIESAPVSVHLSVAERLAARDHLTELEKEKQPHDQAEIFLV